MIVTYIDNHYQIIMGENTEQFTQAEFNWYFILYKIYQELIKKNNASL